MTGKYRRDIDGLRALAVLLVLAVHAAPHRVPNGFIGVDVFFVISGFLITGILAEEFSSASFSLRNFYVRRINRIFPALLIVLAFVLLAGPYVMYPDEYSRASLSAWMSTLFAANIGFYLEAGYWDVASKLKPLLHIWSLGVEEQFYLIWPLILLLAFKKKFSLVNVALGLVFISLSLNLYLTPSNQAAAFYLPFDRLWELAAGGLLALLNRRERSLDAGSSAHLGSGTLANVFSGGALLLLVVTQITPMEPSAFPGYYAPIVVAASALFIAAGPQAWLNRTLLSNPVAVYIGKISYPLYLWHWPLLVAARLIGDGNWSVAHRNWAVLASILLAILTYHCVEKRLATIRRRGVLALVLLALMVVACVFAGLVHKGFMRLGSAPYPNAALTKYDKPAIVSNGKIALLGDSNAGHMDYGLRLLYGDRLETFAMPGWPFLDGVKYRDGYVPHPDHKGTPAETEKALRAIESDPAVRLVIVSNAFNMYLPGDNLRSIAGAPSETVAQAYETGIRRTVQRLLTHGKKVMVIESIPIYPMLATVLACNASSRPPLRHQPADCVRPRFVVEAERTQYRQVLEPALAGLPGVVRFNTMDYLCDQHNCYVNRDGLQMYMDSGHYTTAGSQIMGAAVARSIEQMLAPAQ